MTSAQRAGSRVNASSFIRVLLAHVRLAARADDCPDRVERGRARDEERAPVLAAPAEVAGVLGHADHPEMLCHRGNDPDASWTGHPDVPALVALHAVGNPL